MLEIQTRTLAKTLQTLQALGVEYIVKDSDGNMHKHGSLESKPEKKRHPRCGLPYGDLTKHIVKYVDSLKTGEVVCVPMYEGGNMKSLHSTVSSHCNRIWGPGSTVTRRDHDKQCVEVLRIA